MFPLVALCRIRRNRIIPGSLLPKIGLHCLENLCWGNDVLLGKVVSVSDTLVDEKEHDGE